MHGKEGVAQFVHKSDKNRHSGALPSRLSIPKQGFFSPQGLGAYHNSAIRWPKGHLRQCPSPRNLNPYRCHLRLWYIMVHKLLPAIGHPIGLIDILIRASSKWSHPFLHYFSYIVLPSFPLLVHRLLLNIKHDRCQKLCSIYCVN